MSMVPFGVVTLMYACGNLVRAHVSDQETARLKEFIGLIHVYKGLWEVYHDD